MDHSLLSIWDLLIIGAYLLLMVLVGVYSVRRIQNTGDYYVAGRSFGPDGNSLRYDHRRKRPDGPGGCGLLQRVQSNFDGNPVSFGNVYFFGTVRENFGYRHAV